MYVVCDINIDGFELVKGDFMGIVEKKIVVKDLEKLEVVKKLLIYMIDDEVEIFIIF